MLSYPCELFHLSGFKIILKHFMVKKQKTAIKSNQQWNDKAGS